MTTIIRSMVASRSGLKDRGGELYIVTGDWLCTCWTCWCSVLLGEVEDTVDDADQIGTGEDEPAPVENGAGEAGSSAARVPVVVDAGELRSRWTTGDGDMFAAVVETRCT